MLGREYGQVDLGVFVTLDVSGDQKALASDLGFVRVGEEGLAYHGDRYSFWLPREAIRSAVVKFYLLNFGSLLAVKWKDAVGQERQLFFQPFDVRSYSETRRIANSLRLALLYPNDELRPIPGGSEIPTIVDDEVQLLRATP